MNKRDRQQLRASIARDLIQGQGEHSPTKELLKQYAPLEGIVTSPPSTIEPRSGRELPVENSIAPHTTVASNAASPWHGATVAPPATAAPGATVERLATVKGELRVPNTINFSLFPTLDPFAKAVYYQLFLLSHGFHRNTCVVGHAKLARSVLMSQRKVQDTITYLERRGLIRRLQSILGGPSKGNVYEVPIPAADMAPRATVACGPNVAQDATLAPHATVVSHASVAPRATNKDDDLKMKSSSKGLRALSIAGNEVENHKGAAAPPEKQASADRDLVLVRNAYERATGNRWSKSDTEAYEANGLRKIPVGKIISVLETVTRRTPTKINSFNYFIREVMAVHDRRTRAWHKKQLEIIVRRVRDNSAGSAGYSNIDFREDVKCACAHEGIIFDNDLYNELVG